MKETFRSITNRIGSALNRQKENRRRIEAAKVMEAAFRELGDAEREEQTRTIEKKMESLRSTNREEWKKANRALINLQTGDLNRYLRERYIKHILPEEYNRAKRGPIEDKVLFLQPRAGLNLSCEYMYRTLEKQGKYKLKLFEMHKMNVSNAEMYLTAVEFVREMATAKAVFTHTFHDYYDYLDIRPETKVIQLWHGCGIIKKLGVSNADTEGRRTSEEFKEYNPYKNYDLVVMPSEEERWVFEDMMGLEKGDPVLQAIGVSRTDEFFEDGYKENCFRKLYNYIPQAKDKKLILYAPTYRGPDSARYSPDRLDVAKFAEALSDDYLLLIKHHGTARTVPEIPEKYRNSFAYDMTHDTGLDINELMTVSDMIISDYSSVVFEFSLFERPILFFMFDIDDYRDSHGMYYSYEEIAECGPIFMTNEEMIDYIRHIDERFDKQKVVDFRKRFMSACDGHATERIIAFFEGENR